MTALSYQDHEPETRPATTPTRVSIDTIRIDLDTQARCWTDMGAVEDLAEDIERGATLPPLDVFDSGDGNLILADGFHRVHAMRRAGRVEVDVLVHHGDVEAARWFACGSNQAHGLRRTNRDKRQAVLMALGLPQAEGLSDREIARHCGVSHQHIDFEELRRLEEIEEQERATLDRIIEQLPEARL